MTIAEKQLDPGVLRANVRFLLNVCGIKTYCPHCGEPVYLIRRKHTVETHAFDPNGMNHYSTCERKRNGR